MGPRLRNGLALSAPAIAAALDLVLFFLVHLLDGRIARGFTGGLGGRGRRGIVWDGALLLGLRGRPGAVADGGELDCAFAASTLKRKTPASSDTASVVVVGFMIWLLSDR